MASESSKVVLSARNFTALPADFTVGTMKNSRTGLRRSLPARRHPITYLSLLPFGND